jgi:hypothetical protein
MLVDVCGSYDDFSGLCRGSAFDGHDAIWYMKLRWLDNHRWQKKHCAEDIFISKAYYGGNTDSHGVQNGGI